MTSRHGSKSNMHRVLVTGGAGYIGSHIVQCLLQQGYQPVVYDSLIRSQRPRSLGEHFVQADVHDTALLTATLRKYAITAVIHCAGLIAAGESVQHPLLYYHHNVGGTLSLLQAMHSAGVQRCIVSSTAAVYGAPQHPLLTEEHPLQPVSPYGQSKLWMEQMVQAYASAHSLRWISLRYFNAAGADPAGHLGEQHTPETHLIPLLLQVARGQHPAVSIFGTDYATPDGTCIRDYIHVTDLAEAHVLALQALETTEANTAYNLGSGTGYSVRQVLDMATEITRCTIPTRVCPRRAGDPPVLVALADRAKRCLGWQPRHSDLQTILATAWQWECRTR